MWFSDRLCRIARCGPCVGTFFRGFLHGTKGRQNEAMLAKFLDQKRVEVMPCDEDTTLQYAQLKLQLKRQGTPIPINDVWIAALVIRHGAALLTRDTDFDHLPQLLRA
jgi:tRNA(fMet)-specific endonuclease VapC